MADLHERIPKEMFQGMIRPMIRALSTRMVIIRLNESARCAIPRQTKLPDLMPKLEALCYEQKRAKVGEELERLWELYFESRMQDEDGTFSKLSDELNEMLEEDQVPADEDKRKEVRKTIQKIVAYLEESEFGPEEIEAVFRFKAFPDVLALYLEDFGKAATA